MNVIAFACAIAGVVVIPKYIEMWLCAARNLCDIGHEVVGNVGRIFAN